MLYNIIKNTYNTEIREIRDKSVLLRFIPASECQEKGNNEFHCFWFDKILCTFKTI